jgi:hypothetical protein
MSWLLTVLFVVVGSPVFTVTVTPPKATICCCDCPPNPLCPLDPSCCK